MCRTQGILLVGLLAFPGLAGRLEAAEARDLCKKQLPDLRAGLERQPRNPEGWERFRACVTELKRWNEGEALARDVLKKEPDQAEAHLLLGISLLHGQRYEPAAEAFRAAALLKPDDPVAFHYLGMASLYLKKPAEAAEAARRAAELAPENPGHFSQLAYAHLLQDQLPESERAARQAIQLDRNQVAAWKILGNLYARQGRQNESDEAFEEAIHANGRLAARSPDAAAPPSVGTARPLPPERPTRAEPAEPDEPAEQVMAQWERFKAALLAGDSERALAYISDYADTRDLYRRSFEQLGARLRTMAGGFGTLRDCEVVWASATCKLTVTGSAGQSRETAVRFEKNSDRQWRIRSF